MKKNLFSAVFTALALMALRSTATPVPVIHGALTVAWTINQQNLDDVDKYPGLGKTTISGPASNKTTNVLQISTSTFTTTPFKNANLLELLANSLNTTFPAGTELVTDGDNVYVTDHTGTNAIVDISDILTVTSTNEVMAGLTTRIQSSTKAGTTTTAVGTGSGDQFIIINYNDSALTTKDGTTTTFQFAGVSASTHSGSSKVSTNELITIKESGSFKLTGFGSGIIRGTSSIIEGSVVGSPAGTESFRDN
jgi:hypothetical protein